MCGGKAARVGWSSWSLVKQSVVIQKRRFPRRLPWGDPPQTQRVLEKVPTIFTVIVLWYRKAGTILVESTPALYLCIASIHSLCFMRLNAFWKSTDVIEAAAFGSSRELRTFCHVSIKKWSVEVPFTPPNWDFERDTVFLRSSKMKCSKTLEKRGVHERFLRSPRPSGASFFGIIFTTSLFQDSGHALSLLFVCLLTPLCNTDRKESISYYRMMQLGKMEVWRTYHLITLLIFWNRETWQNKEKQSVPADGRRREKIKKETM